MRRLAAALLVAAGCDGPPSRPACERSPDGVWRGDGVVLHLVDRGAVVDGYLTDGALPGGALPDGVRAAPPLLELVRNPDGVVAGGRWSRRYELPPRRCVVAAPVRVTSCRGGELTLELGPLAPPTDWSACPPAADPATLARAPLLGAPLALHLRR